MKVRGKGEVIGIQRGGMIHTDTSVISTELKTTFNTPEVALKHNLE